MMTREEVVKKLRELMLDAQDTADDIAGEGCEEIEKWCFKKVLLELDVVKVCIQHAIERAKQ